MVENGKADPECVSKTPARRKGEPLGVEVASETDRLGRHRKGASRAPKPGRSTGTPRTNLWPEEGHTGAKRRAGPEVIVEPGGEGDGVAGREGRTRSLPYLT